MGRKWNNIKRNWSRLAHRDFHWITRGLFRGVVPRRSGWIIRRRSPDLSDDHQSQTTEG